MPRTSNQRKIADLLFDYLKESYSGESTSGIPVSSTNDVKNLVNWAKGPDGIPFELRSHRNIESLRKSLMRSLELLMEQFPGAVGFYIPESDTSSHFYTLKPAQTYEDSGYKQLGRKAKYYLVKGDIAISSLNMAFAQLMQDTLGKEDFGFLENTVAYTLSYTTDELKQPEGQFHQNWLSKIEISPRYQSLYPPFPGEDAEEICRALFLECSFTGSYLNIAETRYWPVRLVRQEKVLYVLCATEEKQVYEEYAIHRFSEVCIDYDEDAREKNQNKKPGWISYDVNEIDQKRKPPIILDGHEFIDELVLEFFDQPAQHLSEVHFHPKELEKTYRTKSEVLSRSGPGNKANHSRVTAYHVAYNYNFLTWILGFGAQVKVMSPDWLRNVVKVELTKSLDRYQD